MFAEDRFHAGYHHLGIDLIVAVIKGTVYLGRKLALCTEEAELTQREQ